jgi:hypothetical protein
VTDRELYDHQVDPDETVNRAVDDRQTEVVRKLALSLSQQFPASALPSP